MKQLLFMSLRAPIKSGRGNLYSVIPHLMQNLYRYLLVWIPAFAGMTMVWFALFPSPAFAANSGIFTVELWVKPTSTIASQALVGKAEELRVFTDSSGYAGCQIKSTTWQTAATGTQGLTLQGWNHVACTYDKSNLTVYVNGVLTKQQALTATIDDTANALLIGQDSSASTPYSNLTGTTDDFKFYNYARTQKQIVSDMGGGAPAVIASGARQSGPIGHWKFDEGVGTTANNSGSQGLTLQGSLSGFASPATSTSGWTQSGKFGKALIFDGSNDKITIPSAASLKGLGAATISVWYKPTANPSANAALYYESTATTGYTRFGVYHNSNGDLLAGMRDTDSGSILSATKTAPFTNGQWYHIVTTVDANTDQLLLYLNGVLVASNTTTKGSFTTGTSADSIAVGAYTGSTAAYINGTIDEVKIYNYALTADEVKLDYNRSSSMVLGSLSDNSSYQTQAANQEYCIPGDSTSCAAPVGRWDFEEGSGTSVKDTSGNANNGTWNGTGTKHWINGKVGKAGNFNGSDDLISLGTGVNYTSGPGSVEMWVKSTSDTGQALLSLGIAANANDREDIYIGNNVTGSLTNELITVAKVTGSGANWIVGYTTNTRTELLDGNWHHITIVYNGYGGTSTPPSIYLDRKSVTVTVGDVPPPNYDYGFSGADYVELGARKVSGTNGGFFNGQMDEVKIYNYNRSAAQVAWDYNRGAPVGHWKFDECQGATANDSSGNSNTGTITIGASGTQTSVGTCTGSANTAWKDGVTGKRNYSLDFDGTDDYVSVANATNLSPGSGNYTMSGWIKTSASYAAAPGWIFSNYGNTTANLTQLVVGTDNKLICGFRDGSSNLAQVTGQGSAINDGSWHHVVCTRNGTTATAYVDGLQIGTATNASLSTITTTGRTKTIGTNASAIGTENFNGQLDDVRVYNYALTATQVKTLYNNGAVNFAPSTGSP